MARVNAALLNRPCSSRRKEAPFGLSFNVRASSRRLLRFFSAAAIGTLLCLPYRAASSPRKDFEINSGWRTAEAPTTNAFHGFEKPGFNDSKWKRVDVPHNWDDYYGFHQVKHGNLHGSAWYRREFTADPADREKKTFLMFEGVGSYATVWVNGQLVGRHAGGRTTFTLDVTGALRHDAPNLIAVRSDHPAGIQDLPWVCGGCDPRTGFSEGSQPMGIFRPVHVIVTAAVRVEPFGVHVWNETGTSGEPAVVHISTEVRNYSARTRQVMIVSRLLDHAGDTVTELRDECSLAPGQTTSIRQVTPPLIEPRFWSPDDPYLYELKTELIEFPPDPGATPPRVALSGSSEEEEEVQLVRPILLDEVTTPCGLCWMQWPEPGATNQPFLFNGKPLFINGTCEYEHLLGGSHAFGDEQIRARVMQFRAAGFNAFRDAHQPHNLRYQDYWERLGVLWWPQFSAQIWFDTPAFRENFKTLLREWVKERRNNPAIILWGLQNESKLPADFAKECCDIIRELDPEASVQRKIVVCNGGEGVDWNVPQSWTGTYGGDPNTYADDVRKQQLVGEYGAFRSLGYHEEGPFDLAKNQPKVSSEDRFTALLETKVRLAESVRSEFCGQFQWLLASHDNPGRSVENCWDGWLPLDQVGVVNNKGLFTSWGESADAFYMYRANCVSASKEPMVYIVSHTRPDRGSSPGQKAGIVVYSNCEEVELFNDFKARSFGKRTRGGVGTHFQWDDVDIDFNVLYAEGSVNGKVVATDIIELDNLPAAPGLEQFLNGRSRREEALTSSEEKSKMESPDVVSCMDRAEGQQTPGAKTEITASEPGRNYLYRVNCGGPEYHDLTGSTWLADRHWQRGDSWGSVSWADAFDDVPPAFASVRQVCGPIRGTREEALFQTYRYGRDHLKYRFKVPKGEYRIELYFVEPWYGIGGGMDCTGWRLFDVAVNGNVLLTNLDIWSECSRTEGARVALKKVVTARSLKGWLEISFPRVASYQAVISAMAISSSNSKLKPPKLPEEVATQPFMPPPELIRNFAVKGAARASDWAAVGKLRTGNVQYPGSSVTVTGLASGLFGCDWIRTPRQSNGREKIQFSVTEPADVFVALDKRIEPLPEWLSGWAQTGRQLANDDPDGGKFTLYRKRFATGAKVRLGKLGAAAATNTVPMFTVLISEARPVAVYPVSQARRDPATNAVEWTFKVSVADTYGLRFRYAADQRSVAPVELKLVASDGKVLATQQLDFGPAGSKEKEGIVQTTTGVMINSGTYVVRLTADGAELPELEAFEVE